MKQIPIFFVFQIIDASTICI